MAIFHCYVSSPEGTYITMVDGMIYIYMLGYHSYTYTSLYLYLSAYTTIVIWGWDDGTVTIVIMMITWGLYGYDIGISQVTSMH